MYRGIIILVVLFILLTVLYQHKKDFRKVICYNSIVTLFLLLALSVILLFRNFNFNKKRFNENFTDEETTEEEEELITKELFLRFDIDYDKVKDLKNLEKTLMITLSNIGIDIKSILNIVFERGSLIVRIEFKKNVKQNDYKDIEHKLKELLKEEVIPIKMTNNKIVFYKGSDVEISKDNNFVEEPDDTKSVFKVSNEGSGVKQSHIKGVGNIFAPRIVIKKDGLGKSTEYVNNQSSQRMSQQSIPQQIKEQCNHEDEKANIMKAQHYRDYNNFNDIKLGTFKKSHNRNKCQDPSLNVRVGKNLDEKTYFPGYSYMPPSNWRLPEKRPPACIAQKKCLNHPVSVFDKGTPSDALEYYGVGSILPKFTYREETDFMTCKKQNEKNNNDESHNNNKNHNNHNNHKNHKNHKNHNNHKNHKNHKNNKNNKKK